MPVPHTARRKCSVLPGRGGGEMDGQGAMRPGKAQAALLLRPGPALTSSWVTGDASPSEWWLHWDV